jgi:hypothetical protein
VRGRLPRDVYSTTQICVAVIAIEKLSRPAQQMFGTPTARFLANYMWPG